MIGADRRGSATSEVRISVCGLAELGGHRETGVGHVLSILDRDWLVREEFGAFGGTHGVITPGWSAAPLMPRLGDRDSAACPTQRSSPPLACRKWAQAGGGFPLKVSVADPCEDFAARADLP